MVAWFSLEHFRNISAARIDCGGESIGIIGPNGSGKTSLLEALYLLAHGRSFRTAQRSSVIARESDRSRVIASIDGDTGSRVGAEISPSKLELRMDSRSTGLAEVASRLPIQLLDPSVHLLVEEGAARRRKLLDWGVFHVEPRFGQWWRAYHRGLRQRNAALRAQMWAVADALGEALVEPAENLDRMRGDYFSKLEPVFQATCVEILGEPVTLEYFRGWLADADFRSSLVAARERERRVRQTPVGPHRADLSLKINARLAREHVSRGQQKLLAASLVLSQVRHLARANERRATLLVDDPAAELDVDNLGKLLAAVRRTPAQVIATSLTPAGLNGLQLQRLFHVKQGEVAPMLYF